MKPIFFVSLIALSACSNPAAAQNAKARVANCRPTIILASAILQQTPLMAAAQIQNAPKTDMPRARRTPRPCTRLASA